MTIKFAEAATIKSRARAMMRAAKELLTEKTLPATIRKQIESISQALKKTWKDLEDDAKVDPETKESLREAANMGHYLEARLHSMFTGIADDMFGSGYLTREERISLSAAIGAGLDAFNAHVAENAPQLYTRRPWTEPEPPADPAALSASEAADLDSDFTPLVEKAVGTDGITPIKLIQPGWGSSGYYPAAVLERDGPLVFTKGLKMFWNHQTLAEESERPEGDLRDLSAELVDAARWVPDHPSGAGLYANAKVFQPYQEAVDELAPHIGVSIRARGRATQGVAEGRSGPIIQAITAAKSVDFVTSPGAGGQILQLFEARRVHASPAAQAVPAKPGTPESQAHKEADMNEEEAKKLQEANARLEKQLAEQGTTIARLQEAGLLREAGEVVALELSKPALAHLPKVTRARLQATLAIDPPLKEGALDREALIKRVADSAQAELAYLAEVSGSGQIRGMGGAGAGDTLTDEQASAQLQQHFSTMGLSEAAAKQAAIGH